MNMHSDLDGIRLILEEDVILWKLLYHQSKYFKEDILSKPDVLQFHPDKKFPIMNHRLKHTPVTDDLAEERICRIIFYPAPRIPQRGNYAKAYQEIDFDIFCHADYNDVDMRLAKLCDRVNELFSNKHIAGMGKAKFEGGKPLLMPDKGYIGYRLTYSFGSLT